LQTGGTQQAAEGILKLSEVMRYLTDGSQKQMISLEEEVSFLQSFIDWQRLRLGDEWNIHFSFKEEGGPYVLPPLLLLTIVENAFKHGVQTTLPAAITIQLTASPNVLILATQNNLPELPDNRTGHSVQNLLKRLEWLYGKNYSLVTNAQDGKYLATLTIPWKANQF
ncbi:MAG TPA: histidine kinase, partial [Phnomibacter sp.]|nr:histidine kinase [Phnomibacter sp.]